MKVKNLISRKYVSDFLFADMTIPKVSPEKTIFEAFKLMKEAGTDYLAVYDNEQLLGVISIMNIAERLFEALIEIKQDYWRIRQLITKPSI